MFGNVPVHTQLLRNHIAVIVIVILHKNGGGIIG